MLSIIFFGISEHSPNDVLDMLDEKIREAVAVALKMSAENITVDFLPVLSFPKRKPRILITATLAREKDARYDFREGDSLELARTIADLVRPMFDKYTVVPIVSGLHSCRTFTA